MPVGAALSEGSSGENISHFASIRIRVTGKGLLRMMVHSLDDMRLKSLVPFTMYEWTRIIPTRIVNVVDQRASFEIGTIHTGEYFRINRIVIFSKEIFKSFPADVPAADLQINPLNRIPL